MTKKIVFLCAENRWLALVAKQIMERLVGYKYTLNQLGQLRIQSECLSVADLHDKLEPEVPNDLINGFEKYWKLPIKYQMHRLGFGQYYSYDAYDFIIGLTENSIKKIREISGDREHKVHKLAEFDRTHRINGDVHDPYTDGNYKVTYDEICSLCDGLIGYIKQENNRKEVATFNAGELNMSELKSFAIQLAVKASAPKDGFSTIYNTYMNYLSGLIEEQNKNKKKSSEMQKRSLSLNNATPNSAVRSAEVKIQEKTKKRFLP